MMKTVNKATKKLVSLLVLLITIMSFNEAKAQDKYGKWLYMASDKPIQYRYFKVKEEEGKVFFKMQIKYDKTATNVYCARCLGYSIFISRDKSDPNDSYKLIYFFYQTDDVITLDQLFSVKKLNNDGRWTSYWDEDKVMPMTKNNAGGQPEILRFATWCVDTFKNDGVEEFNRCKRDFEGMQPVRLGLK